MVDQYKENIYRALAQIDKVLKAATILVLHTCIPGVAHPHSATDA